MTPVTARSAVTVAACLMILTATVEGSHALSIDSSFGTNGYVTIDASPTDETSFVISGADGSSYVGVAPSTGAGGFVARLSANGTLDSGYGTAGRASVHARLGGLDPVGRLLIVDSDSRVARLTSSGQIDGSFGAGGYSPQVAGSPMGLAVDRKGRTLVTSQRNVNSVGKFLVTRFTAVGTVDRSYGKRGTAVVSLGGSDHPYDIAVDAKGRAVVVGDSSHGYGRNNGRVGVIRLNGHGRLDTKFGTKGRLLLKQADQGMDVSIAGQSIYISINKDQKWVGALKVTSKGRLDKHFGRKGVVKAQHHATAVTSIAVHAGQVVVGANVIATGDGKGNAYTTTGALATYSTRGKLIARASLGLPPTAGIAVSTIAISSTGQVLVGGDTAVSPSAPWPTDSYVARLNR